MAYCKKNRSLINIAAVGGSAGITNGFISGTGNSLVGGKNIGESLGKGLDAAWKQGLAGAAIGGISAGISAIKHGRTFWTGTRKGSMYVSAERLSINVPEQKAELNLGNRRTKLASVDSKIRVHEATYYEAALEFEGTPYEWGGMTNKGIDCSGLVNRATGNETRIWTTSMGVPPGDWVRLTPSTDNYSGFVDALKVGDLLVWPSNHTAFSSGSISMFHSYSGAGVSFTSDLKYYLKEFGYPDLYRQIREIFH
jgi:cell wall-associated NlpC family hydrolase